MAVINVLKIISIIKKLFLAALFVAFLYLSVKALIHVFSFRTILVVSKEHRNITSLPAFSVCENIWHISMGFGKKDLVNGSMELKSFAVKFEVNLYVDEGNGVTSRTKIDLMDDSNIQNNFHNMTFADLWTLQCKPFILGNSNCMPCITFNGAHLKKQSIELVRVNFHNQNISLQKLISIFIQDQNFYG